MKSAHKTLITLAAVTSALLASVATLAQSTPTAAPSKNREAMHANMRAHMEDRLKAADTDKDGLISKAEAEQNLPRLAQHFDAIDTNKDGKLAPEELKAMHHKMQAHRHHGRHGAFGLGRADADRNGTVTRAEAEKLSQKIMQDFDAADANKDGQLTADEMRAMRTKMRAQAPRSPKPQS